MNLAGYGLYFTGSGGNVDVTECCLKKCECTGMVVSKGATAAAIRCEIMYSRQQWSGDRVQ